MGSASSASSPWVVDPAFGFAPAGSLAPPQSVSDLDAWRHLTIQICRDPLDLESHVRRILLGGRTGQGGRAFSALVDLFLALGPAAKGLRSAMLDAVQGALTGEERDYLRAHLEAGLARGSALPMGVNAALGTGMMGSLSMVTRARREVAEETAVQRAAALLDQGDVAAARRLLEDTLVQSPDADDVATELMLIYRHSRDQDAIQAMKERLMTKFGRLPASWA